jgi:hypothetical protein
LWRCFLTFNNNRDLISHSNTRNCCQWYQLDLTLLYQIKQINGCVYLVLSLAQMLQKTHKTIFTWLPNKWHDLN